MTVSKKKRDECGLPGPLTKLIKQNKSDKNARNRNSKSNRNSNRSRSKSKSKSNQKEGHTEREREREKENKKKGTMNETVEKAEVLDGILRHIARSLDPGAARTLFGGPEAGMKTTAEAFQRFDENSNGVITKGEFRAALKRLDVTVTALQLRDLFRALDSDGDGNVTYEDFLSALDRVRPRSPKSKSVKKKEAFAEKNTRGAAKKENKNKEQEQEQQYQEEPQENEEDGDEERLRKKKLGKSSHSAKSGGQKRSETENAVAAQVKLPRTQDCRNCWWMRSLVLKRGWRH